MTDIDKTGQEECPVCRGKEIESLRRELSECRKNHKAKDRKIKTLDKRVFVLTLIAIGIGAILGKEVLDKIVEWLDTANGFRRGVDELILPSPGTLALFAIAFIPAGRRRRK
tara:strand:+ start:108 stop:443 length:336 start_codon:yes stop_codon:yes gene_type:complete